MNEWINAETEQPSETRWTLCAIRDTRTGKLIEFPMILEYNKKKENWWSPSSDYEIAYWMDLPKVPNEGDINV